MNPFTVCFRCFVVHDCPGMNTGANWLEVFNHESMRIENGQLCSVIVGTDQDKQCMLRAVAAGIAGEDFSPKGNSSYKTKLFRGNLVVGIGGHFLPSPICHQLSYPKSHRHGHPNHGY